MTGIKWPNYTSYMSPFPANDTCYVSESGHKYYLFPLPMADAVEIEFYRNRYRFKTLHYKDQMRLMSNYLLYGQMPFECMTPGQKTDFKRMAKNYALDSNHSTLLRQITSRRDMVKYQTNVRNFTPICLWLCSGV